MFCFPFSIVIAQSSRRVQDPTPSISQIISFFVRAMSYLNFPSLPPNYLRTLTLQTLTSSVEVSTVLQPLPNATLGISGESRLDVIHLYLSRYILALQKQTVDEHLETELALNLVTVKLHHDGRRCLFSFLVQKLTYSYCLQFILQYL